MSNILDVKNLKISFRTNNGTVKAVRDISFSLEKGETLAIVGESGSGKSVTSKAILGILAGNSIVEGGEILYDGKNLLEITEEDMCKIRGDKISMIFQDPLSSLDPIVKIGRQITEAMLLKNKQNRKMGRKEFNTMLATLKKNMIEANAESKSSSVEEINTLVDTFDKFNIEAIKLENSYQDAYTHAEELLANIEDKLFLIEKKQKLDIRIVLNDIANKLAEVKDVFLTYDYDSEIARLSAAIKGEAKNYSATNNIDYESSESVSRINDLLGEVKTLIGKLLSATRPNFFRIGYYKLKNPDVKFGGMNIDKLNEDALEYLNANFMNRFIELEILGLKNSFNKSLRYKNEVIEGLKKTRQYFSESDIEIVESAAQEKAIRDKISASIDELQINKDTIAYTFNTTLSDAIKKYFYYKRRNPIEERRYEKQCAKREALIAKGKNVDWKPIPKTVYDLDELKSNIVYIIDRLSEKYIADIQSVSNVDFDRRAIELIDFFKEKASQVVYKLTKSVAREKAIKIMDEVGIPEARIRYNQYPFEFSGGMRQRIVIAIALAANPDILICDEPTTALDVTIQAQILELINKIKKERQLSVIFITHDLGVVANMADRVAVMYAGKIVEEGTSDEIFYDPRHPYTWALLSSMPDLDTNEKLESIPGTPPNMIYPPKGDAFAARNRYALKIDFEEQPPMFDITPTHKAATWLLHPDAPKVEMPKTIRERIERMKKNAGGEANA